MTLKRILLVEDNARDIELVLEAFAEHRFVNQIDVARDGAEALDYLHRRGAHADRPSEPPVLVLLDLKMPKVDGLEVLRAMKADAALRRIPVVMMTSSREESDLARSYDLGVNSYVVKPVQFQTFVDSVMKLGIYWALVNEPPPNGASSAVEAPLSSP